MTRSSARWSSGGARSERSHRKSSIWSRHLQASPRSRFRTRDLFQQLELASRQLTEWNQELEQRVESQVGQIERIGRLKRFLSPAIADLIVSEGDESVLESHRREITVVFCDLRGFTSFAETVEPEDTMSVLREYHAALGELVFQLRGDVGAIHRRRADGLLQ